MRGADVIAGQVELSALGLQVDDQLQQRVAAGSLQPQAANGSTLDLHLLSQPVTPFRLLGNDLQAKAVAVKPQGRLFVRDGNRRMMNTPRLP